MGNKVYMINLKYKNILTKQILKQGYIKNKKSTIQIGKELEIPDRTVARYLKMYNIPIQPNHRYIIFTEITKNKLKHLYIDKLYSISQIAKTIGCTPQNIWSKMIKFNIARRNSSESKKGELHHNYIKNLNRKYPKEFNQELKNKVRKRDNYTCQCCGLKEKDHYRNLDVHHKNHDKYDLRLSNLIALCQSCHMSITNQFRNKSI